MFVMLRFVGLAAGDRANAPAIAKELPVDPTIWQSCGPVLIAPAAGPATLHAPDIVIRTVHRTEADGLAARPWPVALPLPRGATATTLGYRLTRHSRRTVTGRIWRALILRIMEHGAARIPEFEAEHVAMADNVREIGAWGLNRFAWDDGPKRFTHIWEQEFDSKDAFVGPYMNTPYHWAGVDRFYDAEMPSYIVDPYLVQFVCDIDGAVLPSAR